MRRVLLLAASLLLPGCVAHTAWNVATLPVRAGSQVVDWTTTSRDEADRNEGRRVRRERERQARAARRAERGGATGGARAPRRVPLTVAPAQAGAFSR